MAKEPYQVIADGGITCDLAEAGDGASDEAVRIESAYKAGYDAGAKAVGEQMKSQVDAQAERFTSMIDDLESQRRALVRESEAAVLRLACEIARRIVGAAAERGESGVKEVISNALKRIDETQNLVVRLNPDDLAELRKNQPDWVGQMIRSGAVELKEDPRIKRGGCVVDGETGSVEAQVERQVEIVEKALLEASR
jgi:flagellar biosynthesis/type III secretory pathway protein FliH